METSLQTLCLGKGNPFHEFAESWFGLAENKSVRNTVYGYDRKIHNKVEMLLDSRNIKHLWQDFRATSATLSLQPHWGPRISLNLF